MWNREEQGWKIGGSAHRDVRVWVHTMAEKIWSGIIKQNNWQRWNCKILFSPWRASILGKVITHSHVSIKTSKCIQGQWATQNEWSCALFFSTSALTNLLRYTWNSEEEAGKFSDYFPFKLLCVLWNDCLHAMYYTVHNVWTALSSLAHNMLKYNSTFGCQWLYENVNVYFNRHVFHCHPTPHTQPIFDPVRRALTRSNRHPLFPTFFLFSAVLVWQHWQRHTPTLFRS